MAISLSDVDSACDRIHNLVQTSGLHFVINQTPWSSYITVRRKFINPGAHDVKIMSTETVRADQLKAIQERNEQLEHKVSEVEYEHAKLEDEYLNAKEKYQKAIDNLH